ncbi:unnamed protein product [Leptidea sinapis]|uniref:Uncharacterized protein n=1 Tax=Leptidea sinapis TaxID=189913 RepID=A0A5E4PWI4_9NEOP|nr:unnamed protein product [Leptidea sinapis]
MYITTVYLVLQCTVCLTIRVPVNWDNDSEVTEKPSELNSQQYFQYTASKPQFAVDVAKFHGVKNPEKHYESYPIRPYTDVEKPSFGQHKLLDHGNEKYQNYQEYVHKNTGSGYVSPITNSYEVYHPYKLEEPALQAIYKDPVLQKIRNDVKSAKNQLNEYEHNTGESNISKDEYLEHPTQTDRRKVPQHNIPARYEIHVPQRRPIYYKPNPINNNRHKILNQKLKHPWHQNYVKVAPIHYRPLKNHLLRLRQQHALTYGDERNEYPQTLKTEELNDKPDGYDIFETGKQNFNKIRNNFDEKINEAVLKNRPSSNEKLELQRDTKEGTAAAIIDENEFVPIKNYAQVRKTETIKHVPKSSAYKDAQSLEEIQNAPRLREAVKSSKNQVVYSEEGYEDSAYDHGGEHKHASDHEGHGGFLKENESSKGKYKIPSIAASFEDEGKLSSGHQLKHNKKYSDEYHNADDETEVEDYSENEKDYADNNDNNPLIDVSENMGRKNVDNDDEVRQESNDNYDTVSDHDISKRDTISPLEKLNSTLEKSKMNEVVSKSHLTSVLKKYPYYNKNMKSLHYNSPLRYAEDLKLIPKKNKDPAAFYHSRSNLRCPDIEIELNPIPDKLNKNGHPDESEEVEDEDLDDSENKKSDKEFESFEKKQRLKGLGDKIDCLKIKYFGSDPLDSPFFKEEYVDSVHPLSDSEAINLHNSNEAIQASNISSRLSVGNGIVADKIQPLAFNYSSNPLYHIGDFNGPNNTNLNIDTNLSNATKNSNGTKNIDQSNSKVSNAEFIQFLNKEDTNKKPLVLRKRRATSFNYEPYKVIQENKLHDLRKIATTGNVNPLLKQLQANKIIEKSQSQKDSKSVEKVDIPENNKLSRVFNISAEMHKQEPQLEQKLSNHKPFYSPVEDRTSVTMDQYNNRVKFNNDDVSKLKKRSNQNQVQSKPRHVDMEIQTIAASNNVEKIIRTTTIKAIAKKYNEEDDYYDEYEDEDGETIASTTTTTLKPKIKKRIHLAEIKKPTQEHHIMDDTEPLKLQLTTRFRSTTEKAYKELDDSSNKSEFEVTTHSPKYKEKKKKSTKTTFVTDTESYGDDNDDMKKEEIDALIGVQHDMDEYMPTYEKEYLGKNTKINNRNENYNSDNGGESENDHGNESDLEEEEEDDDDDEEDDENDTDDDEEEEDDDEEDDEINNNRSVNNTRSSENIYKNDTTYNKSESPLKIEITTSEPTKRTLLRTTDKPIITTVKNSQNHQLKPNVYRKKIEIHKELPVNKSSPHITHFKQDIKEVEIVKELDVPKQPPKLVNKNLEQLDLYKSDNLAKEINELGGVEIFIDDLDLESGPKHGGNYRSISAEDLEKEQEETKKGDTEASQSQTKKSIELVTSPTSNSPKSRSDVIRSRSSNPRRGRTENVPSRQNTRNRFASEAKSGKLIELKDEKTDNYGSTQDGNFRSYNSRNNERPMHGGNYRSAKLIQADTNQPTSTTIIPTTRRYNIRRSRKNEAELLNRYAQAVPILTTTPPFILDPSKRMYYYVEA